MPDDVLAGFYALQLLLAWKSLFLYYFCKKVWTKLAQSKKI